MAPRGAMRGFKILLYKAYFDKGFAVLNYVKYVVAVVGVGAAFQGYSLIGLFLLGLCYGMICFVVGWLWFRYSFIETEQEIQNLYNPFCRDVREKFKKM